MVIMNESRFLPLALVLMAVALLAHPGEAALDDPNIVTPVQQQHQADEVAYQNQDNSVVPATFTSVGLAKLSQVQRDLKSLPLDKKCQAFEEALREILSNQQAFALASKPMLFRSAISSLASRRTPFQNGQQAPLFVEPLSECVDKLSAYQDDEEPSSILHQVVANELNEPNEPNEPLGQDLYANNHNHLGDHYEARGDEELKYHGVDETIDYEINEDVPPPQAYVSDGGLYDPYELRAPELADEERYRPQSKPLSHQYILDETLDELTRKEREPVRKLELQLEAEQRQNKRLLQQLDDNQYEIGELREHLEKLKKIVGQAGSTRGMSVLEESRFGQMKLLYDQACERELRQRERYEQLERKYEDLEAKLALERSFDDYPDEGDHDDDDDDDDDEDDKEAKAYRREWLKKLGKKMDQLSKKERKELEKLEKKELKAREKMAKNMKKLEEKKEKMEKKLGGKEVERNDKGEKIYRDPVDIARKLQNRMESSELPEQRCQKYYMLLNHPGKITKKVLKTVAKLHLPKVAVRDPEFYSSLTYYAQLLSRSDNEDARDAAEEMKLCLRDRLADGDSLRPAHVLYNSDDSDLDSDEEFGDFNYSPASYLSHYVPGKYGGIADQHHNHQHHQKQQHRPASTNYYDQNPRWFSPVDSARDGVLGGRKPSVQEIPVEFISSNTRNKPLSRVISNKYAYASGAGGSAAAAAAATVSGFSKFPSNRLAQFQAEHY